MDVRRSLAPRRGEAQDAPNQLLRYSTGIKIRSNAARGQKDLCVDRPKGVPPPLRPLSKPPNNPCFRLCNENAATWRSCSGTP